MQNYHELLQDILDNGVERHDRTGIGTSSVFGRQLRFDLRLGFPAITTKKLAWRAVVGELLWFLEGSGDERRLAEITHGTRDDVTTIWTPNALAPYWQDKAQFEGDLGRVYGTNWREWRETRFVSPKIFTPESYVTEFDLAIKPDFESNIANIVGNTYSSNSHGDFVVIKEYYVEKHLRYDCKFIKTGYIAKNITKQNILETKQVRDLYAPTRYGIGAVGDISDLDINLVRLLMPTWDGMLSRCYNSNSRCFERYGAKGIHVDKRWHIFENFAKDFKKIPRWELKLEWPKEYTLDKDICGTNRYSVNTCIWASKKEQVHNSGASQFYRDPDTNELKLVSKTFNDQIKTLVAGLKHDPYSRRHILSAWNVGELDQMALPPCHMMSQYWVNNSRELSCMFTMRSTDMFLGAPFNIASYALLTHMIAHVCDLKVGELVMNMGDTHIYHNHIDQVREQLTREHYSAPRLYLNYDVRDINKFTMNDIILDGYTSHPPLKAPMAV